MKIPSLNIPTTGGPGWSGAVRDDPGLCRGDPCWHRGVPGWSVLAPGWSGVIRVGTVLAPGVVRDGPWRLRAGSGMICTAAGAMPGRSGAVRSGTVLGPGRRSAVAIFWTKHPGPSRITPDHGPGWSGVVRARPCWSGFIWDWGLTLYFYCPVSSFY